jgi:8-oxo-dGTP pyrophosphatase MutT (NUDIX family)
MHKWQILSRKLLIQSPLFKFMQYKFKHGDKDSTHNFYILETNDWVNIIPLTKDNQVVLIRQYRAGIDQITIEIPGGIIDEKDEGPLQTAARELEEESGYIAKSLEILGFVHPNPSFMTNKCYFILARDVEPKVQINFDPSEYIETFLVPLEKIPQILLNQEINHSLTHVGFNFLFLRYPELLNLTKNKF